MKAQIKYKEFDLLCFKPFECCNQIKASGLIGYAQGLLKIKYLISGNIDLIEFENKSTPPSRKKKLWEKTCFELFVKQINEKKYWEFNLSPTGDWNVFMFEDYRKNMIEDRSFTQPVISLNKEKNVFSFSASINIEKIFEPTNKILAAISLVLKHKNKTSFWALSHPEGKPDFHHINNFRISLN